MEIKAVSIDAVRPSTYNPRKADPRRLALVELSLRKLGFLLPMFADADGELLSGHQRHHVASLIGCTMVPVSFTEQRALEERKAINIAFNRGTNDLRPSDTPETLTAALNAVPLDVLSARVQDRDPKDPAFLRCLTASDVGVRDLAKANAGRWVEYSKSMAASLAHAGVEMPVVLTPSLRVVNGIGRLQLAAEQGRDTVRAVIISEDEAELADALLNGLTMDFDIHTRYADLLRYNSFRRARRVRAHLGRGFVFGMEKGKPIARFDISQPANAARWLNVFGTSVVDFGAGHLQETEMLRSAGVKVAAFEPFRMGASEQIDKEGSVSLAREFLEVVATGREFSSVFVSSVLNSVPFIADRRHIVRICAALCGPKTRLYAVASSTDQAGFRQVNGSEFLNASDRSCRAFSLDYETGIRVGDFMDKPKVQKYHTASEFHGLFREFFGTVQVTLAVNNTQAVAVDPLPVDAEGLRESIAFEFDLPYPDGSRMGLVDEATAAFSKRLGAKL